MINLIVLNFIVGTSALLIVKRFFIFEHTYDYFITLFVVYLAQVVLTVELLGVLNILCLKNLFLINGLVLVLICLLSFKAGVSKGDGFVVRFQDTIGRLGLEPTERFAIAAICGFALVKIIVNLVNPPFGWDSLNYHFTFAVEWLKNHNLDTPIVAFCDPSPTYYPINGSLFFLWFMMPIKSVFIADLAQAPFFVLSFMAVYSLSRKMRLCRKYALFAAAVFLLVPNYFKQLEVAYVDVMVAALFLCALNYLFLLKKNPSLANACLCCAAIGLMMGIKTTALLFVPLLMVLFVYFWLTKLKRRLLIIILGLLIVAATGGFSYIRNYLQTGNFLYPLNADLGGFRLFKGVIDSAVYRQSIVPGDYNLVKILFSEGLGVQAVVFMFPALLFGLWLSIKKAKVYSFDLSFFLLLPLLLALVFRFLIPLPNLRYIYALLGICSVIAFLAAKEFKVPVKILKILIVICVVASAFEISGHGELLISLLLCALVFFMLPAMRNFLIRLKIDHMVMLGVILCFGLFFLYEDYVKNEYGRYVKTTGYSGFWPDAAIAWDWFNSNTEGNRVAYAGRPVPFPLYGTNFKNDVYYVSVNEQEPAKLHYYPNSRYIWDVTGESRHAAFSRDNNYRGRPDYGIWRNNLLRRGTDYLFVYSLHHTKKIDFPLEDGWAKEHPELFSLIFSNETIHIYKVAK